MVLKFRLSCSRVYKYQTLFYEFFFVFFIFESFMQVLYYCVAKSPLNYIEARIIYINDHMKRLFSNNRLSINYYFTVIILYGIILLLNDNNISITYYNIYLHL